MLMFRPFTKYVDFTGRARRSEYWLFQLFQILVALGFIAMIIASMSGGLARAIAGAAPALGLLGLFILGCFLPNLAVTVRRLHDGGRSAWWLLLYLPAMISGFASAGDSARALAGMTYGPAVHGPSLISLIAAVANIVMFVFMVLPGTRGTNRFGPDPKGDGTDIARVFDAPESEGRGPEMDDRPPHKPIFDFGPQPAQQREKPAQAYTAQAYTPPPRPTPTPFAANARPTFGKRR